MGSKILSYGETCINNNKNAFHKATSVNIYEVEIKVMLFDKTSYGNKGSFKYYIGYRHKNEAPPSSLSIKLPQLRGGTKILIIIIINM